MSNTSYQIIKNFDKRFQIIIFCINYEKNTSIYDHIRLKVLDRLLHFKIVIFILGTQEQGESRGRSFGGSENCYRE